VSRPRILAVIGVSDEETAHLRLLMRKGLAGLDSEWQLGGEQGADLLIVDHDSLAGRMARARAQATGVRFAVFSDAPVDDADLVLARPLRTANLRDVLNRASGGQASSAIGANTADFYTRDLGDEGGQAADSVAGEVAAHGLDDLLRPSPIELRTPAVPLPEAGLGHAVPPPRTPADVARARARTTSDGLLADTTPHDLRAYLDQDLLRMPARFALPGMAPLVLDPKNKVAHVEAGIATLEAYCRARWRPCDWESVTSSELSALRAKAPAQPYSRLVWLYVLLHSGGQLARHLDPGGTYRLVQWTEIDRELGRYFRVATALLQPLRLHEIAAASGAPMADVFDVVNAYDAIDLIEWKPRARRDDGQPTPSSLLSKLRNPFGKS